MEKISVVDIENVIFAQENTINLFSFLFEYFAEAPEIDYSDAENTLVSATSFIIQAPQYASILDAMYYSLKKQKEDLEKIVDVIVKARGVK